MDKKEDPLQNSEVIAIPNLWPGMHCIRADNRANRFLGFTNSTTNMIMRLHLT